MAGSGTAQLRQTDAALVARELVVDYRLAGGHRLQAVSDVSFDVKRGETLGLVGESGCGKSTTGRAIMQMPRPTGGSVRLDDTELTTLSSRELRALRTKMQMIFQDPISSLNPRQTVLDLVGEPMAIWKSHSKTERIERARSLLDEVGLDPDVAGKRHPYELSGGQCQRVSIARSIALNPSLLICDEPVSALDVSVQAQVLNLLEDIKEAHSLTMLFIAHDLAVVKNLSDRVCVMYLGKVCEIAPSDTIYAEPAHHYSAALIDAIPVPDPTLKGHRSRVGGAIEIPSPMNPPSGCRYRTRCPAAQPVCAHEEPQMAPIGPDHFVACHFPRVPKAASNGHMSVEVSAG